MIDAGFSRPDTSRIDNIRNAMMNKYLLPVITLAAGTPPDQVCFIFEKINSSGLMLSMFELLNAKLYRAPAEGSLGMNLAQMWSDAQKKYERLKRFGVKDLYFLQTLALLHTKNRTPSCKRKDIFSMTVEDVQTLWERALDAVNGVLKLMEDKAGIRNETWFPFPTMIPALSVIYDSYNSQVDGKPGSTVCSEKLLRWYWCSVFTNRYANAVETKLSGDMRAVCEWIEKDDTAIPDVVQTFRFSATSLRHARSRSSAVYQGVFCLVLRSALDFHNNTPLTGERIGSTQDHHIFPKATLRGKKEARLIDCVINRTLIDEKTNNYIRAKLTSVYIKEIRKNNQDFEELLASHAISEKGVAAMEHDAFDDFLNERELVIANLIQNATKGVVADCVLAQPATQNIVNSLTDTLSTNPPSGITTEDLSDFLSTNGQKIHDMVEQVVRESLDFIPDDADDTPDDDSDDVGETS
jgi:hypothetical protein